MTAKLIDMQPADLAARLRKGRAVVVDIREPGEFAQRHIKGALSRPLSAFEQAHLKVEPGADVVFTCRSGMRTNANRERLAATVDGTAYVLAGGLDASAAAGLPVAENVTPPAIDIMRQVHIVAGALILGGVILGAQVNPGFFVLSGFVGAALIFAGVSGFCLMAKLLGLAPWNRGAA